MLRELRGKAVWATAVASATAILAALLAIDPSSEAVAATDPTAACRRVDNIEPEDFRNPARIDHKFLPFSPGTQFVLEGVADNLPHRVVYTVTDLTKVIDGVETRVIWDRDFSNGVLKEEELAFKAQDKDGNVWNMGEYPEEYEGGQFIGAPNAWITGVAGAEAGVQMPKKLRAKDGYFLQGYVPPIDFLDCGTVAREGLTRCVPSGCYKNVIEIQEYSPLAPEEGFQLKYYAPGIGVVEIGAGDTTSGELLRLTEINHLSAAEMADARANALRLERRAYQIAPVYWQTTQIGGGAPPTPDMRGCAPADDDGVIVIRCLSLIPSPATGAVGTQHTVTAVVTDNDIPVAEEEVVIRVKSGPNAGRITSGESTEGGLLQLTYAGSGGAGTDQIEACLTNLLAPGLPCLDFGFPGPQMLIRDEATMTWQ